MARRDSLFTGVSHDVPASGRKGVTWTLVALAAALLLALLAAVLFLLPRTGTVIVSVLGPTGAHVEQLEVRVDGEVKCRQSPCRIEQLTPGEHRLNISAAGYQPPEPRSLVVEAGTDAVVEYRLMRE